MRAGNTYRGSKKREARRRGLVWRFLDMIALTTGERRVKYPFEIGGRAVAEAKTDGQ